MDTTIDVAAKFDKSWNEETYTPPWRRAIETLTPEQAAWRADGAKYSIWQIVEHMAFWHEQTLFEFAGGEHDDAAIARGNWPTIDDSSADAWAQTVTRAITQHDRVRDAMASSEELARKLHNFIEHDAYHVGQIMLLRALQGLPPLDTFGQ